MKRNLLIGTLLAVTLSSSLSAQVPLTVLTDLQGHPLASPRPVESLGALRVGGGTRPDSESILPGEANANAPRRVHGFRRTSGQQLRSRIADRMAGSRQRALEACRMASPESAFRLSPGPRTGSQQRPVCVSVTFSHARWDPTYSKINYGPKTIAQDVKVSDSAKSKLVQNDSDAYVHVTYTESEAITNAFSTTVTHGITLDMTTSSETEVGGEYAGVSAKQTLTLEFGIETTDEENPRGVTRGNVRGQHRYRF